MEFTNFPGLDSTGSNYVNAAGRYVEGTSSNYQLYPNVPYTRVPVPMNSAFKDIQHWPAYSPRASYIPFTERLSQPKLSSTTGSFNSIEPNSTPERNSVMDNFTINTESDVFLYKLLIKGKVAFLKKTESNEYEKIHSFNNDTEDLECVMVVTGRLEFEKQDYSTATNLHHDSFKNYPENSGKCNRDLEPVSKDFDEYVLNLESKHNQSDDAHEKIKPLSLVLKKKKKSKHKSLKKDKSRHRRQSNEYETLQERGYSEDNDNNDEDLPMSFTVKPEPNFDAVRNLNLKSLVPVKEKDIFEINKLKIRKRVMKRKRMFLDDNDETVERLCSLCGFTCTGKSVLKLHLKSHVLKKDLKNKLAKTIPKSLYEFYCSICGFESNMAKSFMSHLISAHRGSKIISCSNCDFYCESEQKLETHKKIHLIKQEMYKCSLCFQNFENVDHLHSHIQEAHPLAPSLTCSLCFKTFTFSSNLKEHLSKCHVAKTAKPRFQCGMCDYKTNRYIDIQSHAQARHSNERPFLCSICGHSFKNKKGLLQHLQSHSDIRTYQCTDCDFAAKTAAALYSHKKCKHSDERAFSCEYCGLSLKTSVLLKRHIFNKHCDNRPFMCERCDFSCKTASSLKLHYICKHSNAKPFACDQCSYAGKTKGQLSYHKIRKHTGEKRVACSMCDYRCWFKWDLKLHMNRNHFKTVMEHLKCPFCDFTTQMSYNLSGHIRRMHTITAPVVCKVCGFTCKSTRRLKMHTLHKHTTEKPFSCNQCEYRCKTNRDLKRHTKEKHCQDKPYLCTFCSYACKRLSALKRHIRLRHNKN